MEKKNYKLTYLSTFYTDLSGIIDYIHNELNNKEAAERFLNNVEHAILKRISNPLIFPPAHINKSLDICFYRIIVSNYSIYYVVYGDTIEFGRILQNRRYINSCEL